MARRGLAAALGALMVVGCGGPRLSPRGALSPGPAPLADSVGVNPARLFPRRLDSFRSLDGWEREDHVAAFSAYRAGCGAARDAGARFVCGVARRSGTLSEGEARAFFERFFRPEVTGPSGLLTAYFTPVYPASDVRRGDFTSPVRPRPADLPSTGLTATAIAPYADRASIEARATPDALAWMKPEDLFILQIQGSGILVFPSGARAKAIFDGDNGAPFRGIAAPMREMGLLPDRETSGEAIGGWLADHRGPMAEAIMRLDPRYVFFRLAADDGALPDGASGVRLIPGRSVAVDPARHAAGELLWIDASAPALTGAFPAYRRLAVALDIGGAIKGESRADLYLGEGPSAGREAGRVRHVLKLYRLQPVAPPVP